MLSDMYKYKKAVRGILADTISLKRTLICLTFILITKEDSPIVSPEYIVNTHSV